jgi:hypothetical protein
MPRPTRSSKPRLGFGPDLDRAGPIRFIYMFCRALYSEVYTHHLQKNDRTPSTLPHTHCMASDWLPGWSTFMIASLSPCSRISDLKSPMIQSPRPSPQQSTIRWAPYSDNKRIIVLCPRIAAIWNPVWPSSFRSLTVAP